MRRERSWELFFAASGEKFLRVFAEQVGFQIHRITNFAFAQRRDGERAEVQSIFIDQVTDVVADGFVAEADLCAGIEDLCAANGIGEGGGGYWGSGELISRRNYFFVSIQYE